MSEYYVYVTRCADNSLYCGISTDPQRRIRQHNGELKGGAKYIRGKRRPAALVWKSGPMSLPSALRSEAEFKSLTKLAKERFISDDPVGIVPAWM